jgi:hypothetical protein
MPTRNYGPATTLGAQRDRIWRVTIDHVNPSSGVNIVPMLTAHEERAVRVRLEEPTVEHPEPAEVSIGRTRDFTLTFTPGAEFELRNPLTDELLGTIGTDDQLYALLYSKLRKAQTDLDAAEQQ